MATEKKKLGLTTQIFIALIVGLVVGIILNVIIGKTGEGVSGFINDYLIDGILTVIGKIFINSIRMLVVPLVLVSLVCGVAGIGDIKKLGRVGGKTLMFYMATTAMAIALALVVASFINPGAGLDIQTAAADVAAKKAPALSEVVIGVVPSNPFRAMVEGKMLQVIFFAMLIGIAIAAVGKKVAGVLTLFEELNAIVMKMISLIMLVAPIGIFCLIAKVFATQGFAAFLPLIKYMTTVIIVLVLHLVLVYTGALRVIGGLSPVIFFKKFYSTMLVAFSTSSSNATIPVTMSTVEKKMGASRSIVSFSIPFGATINMDGTAIMQGVAVVFISQVYGIDLTFTDFLLVILTATLASVGTAGVPGVGLITLSMVLTQVGLPVEGIALIMGVDRLLDMSRTAVNISGDAIVSLLIAKSEGEFNVDTWNDPDAGFKEEHEELGDINEKMNQNKEFIEKLEEDFEKEE